MCACSGLLLASIAQILCILECGLQLCSANLENCGNIAEVPPYAKRTAPFVGKVVLVALD